MKRSPVKTNGAGPEESLALFLFCNATFGCCLCEGIPSDFPFLSMRSRIFLLIPLVCLLHYSLQAQVAASITNREYTRLEILEDLDFLEQHLTEKHPGLYEYADSGFVVRWMDSLRQALPEKLSEQQLYADISRLCHLIGDGHTMLFPSSTTTAYYNAYELFFPMRTFWDGEHLYTYMHYSDADTIADGTRILYINGIPAEEVVQFCLDRITHDGYNKTYPVWVLNNWFAEFYGYFYGHPSSHTVVIQEDSGTTRTVILEGVPKPSMISKRQELYPQNDLDPEAGKGITLQFSNDSSVAILTIRDFHNKVLRRDYGQYFKGEIREIFEEIEASGTKRLVLDLRNNQGGEIRNGYLLLRYIMNEPFYMMYSYNMVSSKFPKRSQMRLKDVAGPYTGLADPADRHAFTGQLAVLVNGGSFSNSAIVTSVIDRYQRGIVVGEETGGNGYIISGDSRMLHLPNTGIVAYIPRRQYVIQDPAGNNRRGIIPEFQISPELQDLIKGNDPAMQKAIELLSAAVQ
ncbi:MAG TPA: hypothetical protein DCG24_05080 [Bacteroidetes bacterium]|nr:hypothetical protein [Bacteroidota bacterium]HAE36228.1 hypothetical protein [Bacteroidota bacterium]